MKSKFMSKLAASVKIKRNYPVVERYSQSGCSFGDDLANFRYNIVRLIDSFQGRI